MDGTCCGLSRRVSPADSGSAWFTRFYSGSTACKDRKSIRKSFGSGGFYLLCRCREAGSPGGVSGKRTFIPDGITFIFVNSESLFYTTHVFVADAGYRAADGRIFRSVAYLSSALTRSDRRFWRVVKAYISRRPSRLSAYSRQAAAASGRISVAPCFADQPPGDLDSRSEVRFERNPVEAGKAKELSVRFPFDGICSVTEIGEFVPDAEEKSGRFLGGQRFYEIFHDFRVGVHFGEREQIAVLPVAQDQPGAFRGIGLSSGDGLAAGYRSQLCFFAPPVRTATFFAGFLSITGRTIASMIL